MRSKLGFFLYYSTGALFLAAAAALFICAETNTALIEPRDPIFSLPIRTVFWIFGGLCLGAGVVSFLCDLKFGWATSLPAWIVIVFGAYWLTFLSGDGDLSGYLGNFSSAFDVSPSTANVIAEVTLGCLLFGSCGTLIVLCSGYAASRRIDRLNMSCPSCGGHINFNIQNVGQMISCPHCATTVVLRKPEENLKISCFFCNGHIAFPPHAIGEKLKCPHCRMEITLKEPAAS